MCGNKADAASVNEILVTSNKSSVSIGDTFDVSLILNVPTEVVKVTGELGYDPIGLELVDSTLSSGGATNSQFTITNIKKKEGEVLGKLTFKVRNITKNTKDIVSVVVRNVKITDSNGKTFEITTSSGMGTGISLLPLVSNVLITPEEAKIESGEKVILTAKVDPEDAANKKSEMDIK